MIFLVFTCFIYNVTEYACTVLTSGYFLFFQFNDVLLYTTPVATGYKLNNVLPLAGMKVVRSFFSTPLLRFKVAVFHPYEMCMRLKRTMHILFILVQLTIHVGVDVLFEFKNNSHCVSRLTCSDHSSIDCLFKQPMHVFLAALLFEF